MLSIKLSSCCSCYVLANSLPIYSSWNKWNVSPFCYSLLKQLKVLSVNSSIIWQFTALLASFITYRKLLPNLVDNSWLWWIMHRKSEFCHLSWKYCINFVRPLVKHKRATIIYLNSFGFSEVISFSLVSLRASKAALKNSHPGWQR